MSWKSRHWNSQTYHHVFPLWCVDVAEVFKEVLDARVGTFEQVVFAVLGNGSETCSNGHDACWETR